MKTRIIYNPRCSKCRQALALLREHDVEPDIIPYLEKPLGRSALAGLVRKLGINPKELVRFKEPLARELGLSAKDERSKTAWIEILEKHPVLLERPIVIRAGKAVVGRPPENILSLL